MDIYFAPSPPAGQENNWIFTREGKPYFIMFRFYGPEPRAVDGSWVLNDIERVDKDAQSLALAPSTEAATPAQRPSQLPYTARAFNPAHADLARSAGVPARLANEAYVESLARIVYYWGYAAVDQFGRHGMWEMLKSGPGLMFGILPGAPMNMTGVSHRLPTALAALRRHPEQRHVLWSGLRRSWAGTGGHPDADQRAAGALLDHPDRRCLQQCHPPDRIGDPDPRAASSCWSVPTGRAKTRRFHRHSAHANELYRCLRAQLRRTHSGGQGEGDRGPGPDWHVSAEQKPGWPAQLRLRSHIANKFYPPGVTAEMLAADPDVARPEWVVPTKFWEDLEKVLAANQTVGPGDSADGRPGSRAGRAL